MRSFLLCAATLFLVTACAGRSPVASESAGDGTILFAVASNRFLELEPCGCPVNPAGGLAREWVIAERWREKHGKSRVALFSSGTQLVPFAWDRVEKRRDHVTKKAEAIVEAMGLIGIRALSPTIEDAWLGVATLRRLQSHASFPFVSANLFLKKGGAPLFDRFARIEVGGHTVVVTGLSHTKAPANAPKQDEIEVRSPAESLAEALTLAGPADLTIVLSSATQMEQQRMPGPFRRAQLILGGDAEEVMSTPQPIGPATLYVSPLGRGKQLAALRFSLENPVTTFHHPEVARLTAESRSQWAGVIKALDETLAQKNLPATERHVTLARRKIVDDSRNRLAVMPLARPPTAVPFEYEAVTLGPDVSEGSDNPVRRLLDSHYEKWRQEALAEGEVPPPATASH